MRIGDNIFVKGLGYAEVIGLPREREPRLKISVSGTIHLIKKSKAVILLSAEEDDAWVRTFNYYSDMGLAEADADEKTAHDMRKEYPRLKGYRKFR